MWKRAIIKSDAKQKLKNSYWQSFGVCILAGIIGGGGGFSTNISIGIPNFASGAPGAILAIVFAIFVIILSIILAFRFFLANPILVGKAAFFTQTACGERKFNNLFYALRRGRYMTIVKAMFMKDLFVFLWSLLFIIPGIVKSYQYRLVPYILGDDPRLSPSQVLQLSRQMADGQKWEMFVLDLSFIGWHILGFLACCIGVIFLTPYVEATWAQLYIHIRGGGKWQLPDTTYVEYEVLYL